MNAEQISATLKTLKSQTMDEVKQVNTLATSFRGVTNEIFKLGAVAFGTGFGLAAAFGPETQAQLSEFKLLMEEIGLEIDGPFAEAVESVTRFLNENRETIVGVFTATADAITIAVKGLELFIELFKRFRDLFEPSDIELGPGGKGLEGTIFGQGTSVPIQDPKVAEDLSRVLSTIENLGVIPKADSSLLPLGNLTVTNATIVIESAEMVDSASVGN